MRTDIHAKVQQFIDADIMVLVGRDRNPAQIHDEIVHLQFQVAALFRIEHPGGLNRKKLMLNLLN